MDRYQSALNDVIRELERVHVGPDNSPGYRMALDDVRAWRNLYETTVEGGSA